MDKKIRTIVIIPTYNEALNIERLISQIVYLQPDFSILIVDDDSPDGTGRVVEKLSESSDKIKILHRPKKSGLGRAYIDGFKYALSQDPPYERIIQMDADFSHHPKYLDSLLKATQDRDFSIGSRYIPDGRIIGWRLDRRVLSCVANVFVRLWLGLKVRDIIVYAERQFHSLYI